VRKVVVVLGAGASVSAGLPSLAGIFEDTSVKEYLSTDALKFFDFLERYVWAPRGIAESERWRSLNLEEVLTMLRLWENDNQSPINFAKNRKYQRQLLGCVYQSVFVGKTDNGCRDYNNLIWQCEEAYDEVTWSSFNWDAKLEQAFYYLFLRVLGASERFPRCHPPPDGWDGSNPKHLLLKLHGSVTWFCDGKGRVCYRHFGDKTDGNETRMAWDAFLTGQDGAFEPMIAEPSFLKHERIRATDFFCEQWREFDRKLATADLVLIVGYSLPDGDAMAKQSLLTAVARNPGARYLIIDPDRSGQVMPRYERVLGPNRMVVHQMTLSQFLANPATLDTLIKP
jgi:hypothetical protein